MPLTRRFENSEHGLTSRVSMPDLSSRKGGIQLHAPEEFQLGQMLDILRDKMTRRGVDVRALDPGDVEAAGKVKRQVFGLKQGIDRDSAKKNCQADQGFQAEGAGPDPGRAGAGDG